MGVSVSLLRLLHGKAKALGSGLTTTEVCNRLVIPETAPFKCAYIDLFANKNDESGRAYVAPATTFVSHAWQYNVEEPIDVMLDDAESRPNEYYWFDICVNNQNIAADLPQDWWSTIFKRSIGEIGRVLLVMSPWDDPIPLTRAWCLWEIMCAIENDGVSFVVRLPRVRYVYPAERCMLRYIYQN